MELTRTEEMGKRYLDLVAEGMGNEAAAKQVAAEFKREGKPGASYSTVRAAGSKFKAKIKALGAGPVNHDTHAISGVTHSETSPETHTMSTDTHSTGLARTQETSSVTHCEQGAFVMTEKLISEFRRIAREEIEAARGVGGRMANDTKPEGPRPTFRRGIKEDDPYRTILKSVRLSAPMWEAVEERAKRDQLKSRGSVNGLIEYLLWEYLGRPGDMIEES